MGEITESGYITRDARRMLAQEMADEGVTEQIALRVDPLALVFASAFILDRNEQEEVDRGV